jgi:histidyl-tRNA synthetase
MSKQKPALVTGTRDFLPKDMVRRDFIFGTIRNVFERFGYQQIQTPTMERMSVLTGKYGEEGDKLLYKVLNSGDFLKETLEKPEADRNELLSDSRALTPMIAEKGLRYDLTVPLARFVVMNRNELVFPFKRYQMQPVWRADRPQKGRYREFWQCDADVIGSRSLQFETEFILIYDQALSALGLTDFHIRLNHRMLLQGLSEYVGATPEQFVDFCTALDKLDKVGAEGVKTEFAERGVVLRPDVDLFKILEVCSGPLPEALEKLAQAEPALAERVQGHIAELTEVIANAKSYGILNAQLVLDLTLARGLNYYTGAIFEVKAGGVQIGSIGGGGRYDNLTEAFGVADMPGAGISFGADRIYDVMDALNLFEVVDHTASVTQVLIINDGEQTRPWAYQVMQLFHAEGIHTEYFPEPAKRKGDFVDYAKQLTYANKKGIPFAVVNIKLEDGHHLLTLRNMGTGNQDVLYTGAALDLIKEAL